MSDISVLRTEVHELLSKHHVVLDELLVVLKKLSDPPQSVLGAPTGPTGPTGPTN
jgi:hypothetical protein